jgi:carbon-monoxide dehydrogenase small subunit
VSETSADVAISVVVNGEVHNALIDPRLHLSDFLRQHLGLTGTHIGCEVGVCGACTVLVDGQTMRSCLTFAIQTDGAHVTTIEGLAIDGKLNPVQQAFTDTHGLQCGFCTPGMLLTVTELLERTPNPSRDHIREVLSGNLCRCTGYETIIDAVEAAARTLSEQVK